MRSVAVVLLGVAVTMSCGDVVSPVREKTTLQPRFDTGSDVAPPVLAAFGLSTTTVDVTAGPADVTANFRVTDDLSGATMIEAFVQSPSGRHAGGGASFTAATDKSGSFVIHFAQFIEAGTWTVSEVHVRDAVGNIKVYTPGELAGLGFPAQVTVHSVSDLTTPVLAAFSLNPTTVDVSAGPANVTANFQVTDNLSGATMIEAFLQSPSGRSAGGGTSFAAATDRSGSFNILFAQFVEPGTWTVSEVHVRDVVNNIKVYTAAELAALGFPTQVTVQSVSDLTLPTLAAFSLNTTTVDVSAGPVDVTATFRATDNLSGVVSVEAFLRSPSSGQQAGGGVGFTAATDQSGSFTIRFAQFVEAGTWTIHSLQVRDAVANIKDYSAAELAALGFPNTVIVQNAIPVSIDIKPNESPNVLKCTDKDHITVAILSTTQFNALTVDHTTVTFGPGRAPELHVKDGTAKRHEQDVDGDGDLDLVFHFDRQQAAIVCGSAQAELNGRTFGGRAIRGTDTLVWL
jgi:hypothetical protein